MTITRWYPFREVASLQNRRNSFLHDFSRSQGAQNESLTTAGFVPPVDVYEDEHKIVLKLEVAGIKQEDLDVRLEDNTLTVRGERKLEKEEREENFHRIERRYGAFSRAFTLPTSVDSENVRAQYDSGVLKLELNKRAEARPKQIKIGVANAEVPAVDPAKAAA